MKDYKRSTNAKSWEEIDLKEEYGYKYIWERLKILEDKIESGEIVDRNLYLDYLLAAKNTSELTDKEIEFFAKHNARVREDTDKELASLAAENQRLREEVAEQKSIAEHEHATQMEWFSIACDYKAEAAALQKRLDNAEELPCKVGDMIYCIQERKIIDLTVKSIIILGKGEYLIKCGYMDKNDYALILSTTYGVQWFTDRAEAEARLAELKGGRE